jgi:hypothetical protein
MQFPGPLRAVVGLLANAADEAKHLPDRAIELPMLAVSTALQVSLRAQQRYARLAARGDEVLHRRPPTDDAPSWATFDEPVSTEELLAAAEAALGVDPLDPSPDGAGSDGLAEVHELPSKRTPAKRAPAKRTAKSSDAPAKATPVNSAVTKSPAKKATAEKQPARKAPAVRAKSVSKPRHTPPSRFDAVDDE